MICYHAQALVKRASGMYLPIWNLSKTKPSHCLSLSVSVKLSPGEPWLPMKDWNRNHWNLGIEESKTSGSALRFLLTTAKVYSDGGMHRLLSNEKLRVSQQMWLPFLPVHPLCSGMLCTCLRWSTVKFSSVLCKIKRSNMCCFSPSLSVEML